MNGEKTLEQKIDKLAIQVAEIRATMSTTSEYTRQQIAALFASVKQLQDEGRTQARELARSDGRSLGAWLIGGILLATAVNGVMQFALRSIP